MQPTKLNKHARANVIYHSVFGLSADFLLILCVYFGKIASSDLAYLIPILPVPLINITAGFLYPSLLSFWNESWYWTVMVPVALLTRQIFLSFPVVEESSCFSFLFSIIFLVIQWKIVHLLNK